MVIRESGEVNGLRAKLRETMEQAAALEEALERETWLAAHAALEERGRIGDRVVANHRAKIGQWLPALFEITEHVGMASGDAGELTLYFRVKRVLSNGKLAKDSQLLSPDRVLTVLPAGEEVK